MKLFGTDGIRGKANEFPITPELALQVARAIVRIVEARQPGKPRVLIGRDTRISGDMLENAFAAGLVSEGAEVILAGTLPTPAVAYLTKDLVCDAGVMLTASHNPFEDNGIKIFSFDGYKLGDDLEERIEAMVDSGTLSEPFEGTDLGKVTQLPDGGERYLAYAKSAFGDLSLQGMKIVVDCANGAAHQVGPLIFERLHAEVVPLGISPDGRNINENCGALHAAEAAERVKQEDADLGVCLDGDADRLVLVDGNGEIIGGDRLLCLAAFALHRQELLLGDTLVATVMSNLGLREALGKKGIALETTAVGDRNVLTYMRQEGYSLGGENSGHLIFSRHSTTGDGLMAALYVLAEMKATGQTLAELAACMDEFPQKLVNVNVSDKPPLETIPGLKELVQAAEAAMVGAGRVLVRYSGTEKMLRVMVEAKDEAVMEDWCGQLVALVEREIGA